MNYFPCIRDKNGAILKKLTEKPMTREEAEDFLKTHFLEKWRNCEAIPQPEKMPCLHN